DELPPELARAIRVPAGAAPLAASAGAAPTGGAPAGQVQGDAIVQEAQGEAAVLDGDRPAARQKAIDDALRRAVEMAAGTRVSATTETKDFQLKMDQVLTHAQGFVRRYEIVREGMDGTVVQVAVRAFIGTAELDKDLEAMGLLMARKGMPRTMVLIAEQNVGMAAPRAVWMRGESALVATDLRIAEITVLDALQHRGGDARRRAARRCFLREGSDQEGIARVRPGHDQEDRRTLVQRRLFGQRHPCHRAQGPLFPDGHRLSRGALAARTRRPQRFPAQLRGGHPGAGRDAAGQHRGVRAGSGSEEAREVFGPGDRIDGEHRRSRARPVKWGALLVAALSPALAAQPKTAQVSALEGSAQKSRASGPKT